jgi:hypothetical protein
MKELQELGINHFNLDLESNFSLELCLSALDLDLLLL